MFSLYSWRTGTGTLYCQSEKLHSCRWLLRLISLIFVNILLTHVLTMSQSGDCHIEDEHACSLFDDPNLSAIDVEFSCQDFEIPDQSNSWSMVSHVREEDAVVQSVKDTVPTNVGWWNQYSANCINNLERELYHKQLNLFEHPCLEPIDSVFVKRLPSALDRYVNQSLFSTKMELPHIEQSTEAHKRKEFQPVNQIDKSAWRNIAQRIGNQSWKEVQDATRSAVLSKWRHIIQIAPQASTLGRQLLSEVLTLKSDVQLARSVEDTFAAKSTKTLIKRVGYVIKYISWCQFKAVEPFPVQEVHVYSFLYDCCWQAPSFGNSFKESLNFLGGVVGMDGALQSAASPRVVGMCSRVLVSKKKLKQAKPLTVKMVMALERLVEEASDPIDRILSGHMLFILYSRSRWSDVQAIESLEFDASSESSGFLEARTYYVKTANTTDKRRTFLPIVAITDGLCNSNWAETWLKERKHAGLPDPQNGIPLLPVINTKGTFGTIPMSPSLGSACLRDLLTLARFNKDDIRDISSHSLKTTCLSWAAKAGVAREHRQILGYHVVQGATSVLHYSRDEQAEPLRQLSSVMNNIRLGKFNPDATRSGFWNVQGQSILLPKPKSMPGPNIEDPKPPDKLHALDSDSSSTSSESEKSDAWSEGERALKINQDIRQDEKRRRGSASNEPLAYAIHKRWYTLHVVNDLQQNKTSCGRILTPLYKILTEVPSYDAHKCQVCFGHD